MKKVLLTLMVLAVAMPALAADVDFAADGSAGTQGGVGLLTISYTSTTAPRGVALLLDVDGGSVGTLAGGENGDVDATAPEFNCFMDYASENPGAYVLGTAAGQHPLAKEGEAGQPDYPASKFSVCMGVLDEGGNQDAGPASANLITLKINGTPGTTVLVDITEDSFRGAVVGDAGLTTNLPLIDVPVTIPSDECITAADGALYTEWVAAGKPDCWCYPTQCKGDADGLKEGVSYYSTGWYVGTADINIMAAAWKLDDAALAAVPNGACADFDHAKEGVSYYSAGWRVGTADINIMAANWKKTDTVGDCYPGNVTP